MLPTEATRPAFWLLGDEMCTPNRGQGVSKILLDSHFFPDSRVLNYFCVVFFPSTVESILLGSSLFPF